MLVPIRSSVISLVDARTSGGKVPLDLLDVFIGSGPNHAAGIVPDPGDTAGTVRFLREDGTWDIPPSAGGGGTGTVSSVSVAVPTGFAVLVTDPTANPIINISTSLNGVIKGNGSGFVDAVAGSDYYAPGSPIAAADVPAIDAGKVATGTLDAARLPNTAVTPGSYTLSSITVDATGRITAAASGTAGGGGTVTSVAITAPAEFTVAGSPIATAGTIALVKVSQAANLVYAGPGSGGSAAPTFRAMVSADIPAHDASLVTSGTFATARLPLMGASGAAHTAGAVPDPGATAGTTRFLREDATWAAPPAGGGGGTPGGTSGQVQVNSAGAFAGATGVTWAGSGTILTVAAQANTDIPLTIAGTAAQSGDLLQVKVGGTIVARLNASYQLVVGSASDFNPVVVASSHYYGPYIQGQASGCGFNFGTTGAGAITPWFAGIQSDATVALGSPSYRFAGLYTTHSTRAVKLVTAAYTATASDSLILADATAGAFAVTLPTAVGNAGRQYTVKKVDASANAVTSATTSAQTIDGATTATLAAQWAKLTVCSDGTNWQVT